MFSLKFDLAHFASFLKNIVNLTKIKGIRVST